MLTVKQEKFVQELVKGKSQREAYKSAYNASRMKDSTVDSKACLIFKKEEVRARYDEIMERSVAKTQDDAESIRAFIIEKLKQIASGELCEQTIEYDREGNVIRTKKSIKPSDVNNAMAKLAEYYGVAPEENTTSDITVTLKGLEEYAE